MHRRDILNIFFNPGSLEQPIRPEPDPVLFTPAHLRTDESILFSKEWTMEELKGPLLLEVSTSYSFTLILNLHFDPAGSYNSGLLMGTKERGAGTEQDIHLGIQEGYLFIAGQQNLSVISKEKLQEGIQLILTVNPLANGGTYAKLKAVDRYGMTQAVLKSKQFTAMDWMGNLQTGVYTTTLRLEGRKAIEHELI